MSTFLIILHIMVCLALIGVVLLQTGKGADMGAGFGGGGSQSVFGASGGSSFISRMTTGAAVIFMLTSLTLAYLSGKSGTSSMMSGMKAPAPQQKQTAPVQQPAPMGQQAPALPAGPLQAPAKK